MAEKTQFYKLDGQKGRLKIHEIMTEFGYEANLGSVNDTRTKRKAKQYSINTLCS